jgi:hypothetical protein
MLYPLTPGMTTADQLADHYQANAPTTWQIAKSPVRGGGWRLTTADGITLDTYRTRKAAAEARTDGPLAKLYRSDLAWITGESRDPRFRPFADVLAEHVRRHPAPTA